MKLFWGKTTTVISHDGGCAPVIKRERGLGRNLRGDAILWKIDFHEYGNSIVRCANKGRIPLDGEVYSVVASDLPMTFKFEIEVGDEKELCDVTVRMDVRLCPDGRDSSGRGTEFSDFLQKHMPSSGVMTRNELQTILTDEQFNLARFMHSKLGVNSLSFYQAKKHDAVSIDDYENILPEWLKIKRIASLAIYRTDEPAPASRYAVNAVKHGVLLAGRYKIDKELGRGGMAVVYLAEDSRWKGKRFAIKMPVSDEARGMMRREADSLKELKHANIACIRDYYDDDANPFMVIDYVEGKTLREYLKNRKRPLSAEHARELLLPIADAIDSAHNIRLSDGRCGIAHRDIKPENIMIESLGGGYEKPYILDFGLARQMDAPLKSRVSFCGTYRYMPPEVLYGTIANSPEALRKWDIYGFAVTVYECLAGKPPCEIRTNDVIAIPPLPANIPFGASVMRALDFNPALRPESCRDLFACETPRLLGDVNAVPSQRTAAPQGGVVLPKAIIDNFIYILGRCEMKKCLSKLLSLVEQVESDYGRNGWRILDPMSFCECVASVPQLPVADMKAKRCDDRRCEILAWFGTHRIDAEFDAQTVYVLQTIFKNISRPEDRRRRA